MKIIFKNASVFYQLKGQGPVVVFLHGFLEDHSMWDFITDHIKDVRSLTIDLPGHGESENFGSTSTMNDHAKLVKFIMDKHKISAATFVGHSMGGYVALAIAQLFETQVQKLILVNSTPLPDSVERLKSRRQAIKLLSVIPDRFVSMAIQNLFDPESIGRLQTTIDLLKDKALNLDPKGIIANVKGMMARPDRTATLAKLSVPKIVIASQNDPIIDATNLSKLSLNAGAQFALLPGGHMSSYEQPERLLKLLEYYLK